MAANSKYTFSLKKGIGPLHPPKEHAFMQQEGVLMGCCNERGVLRPLLSGSSAASRNGNSASRYQNNGDSSARYNRNKKRSGRKTGNKSANDISQRHITNSEQDDYDDFDDDDEDINVGYSTAASYWCCIFSEMLRKIGLLVWKNLLFRKRHWVVTALEIILPTLCAMILASMKTQAGGGSHIDFDVTGNQTTIFPGIKEEDLKLLLALKVSCTNCIVAYAPDSDQTKQVIQELASNLQGTKIDWQPFADEGEIEKLLASLSFNNTASGSLRAAIVFENGLEARSSSVSYKIRMVDDFHDTGLLFPWFQLPGPNGEHVKHYAESGFSGFQVLIDKILAKRLTGQPITHSISLQAFPYPPYTISFDFNMLYFILLPQLFVLGFIFMVPSIIRAVVSEKETGIRELLKLNGLRGWMQWVGWMLNSLLILIISITIVIFLLFWTFDIHSGAVLVYSDPTVWWVVLFLFAMSASSFCFFISSFFIKPTLATTVGIILWLSSYYFFFVPLEKNYQSSSFMDKITVALIPNMALHLAIKVMSAFEGKAVGAQWSNIAEPISSVDPLALGHVILMFLLNTCMYMFLAVYVENVLPSEYGVRKPWYYIFQPSTYRRRGGGIKSRPGTSLEPVEFDNNMPGFETQPSDINVGVEIKNLRKVFGRNKAAVNGVNAKMYDGEIFALLGHNGAGKTTTISMLTGLFAPSGGTATVNGYDITTELDMVRDNLGLCPQHNMLFDKLTVSEHLRFFGQLKGLTSSEATKEMKELLKKLQLSEKESTLSRALSGGQKRKLSLGIALIGGTKVVILDEPTSGMDPEARRAIWDLLLEMRGQRTILLTTHFMEEADVLGDRIGIMAAGKLVCCGTSMYLKKFYGTGYTLKLSISENEQRNTILTVIQKYVSNASIKASHSTNTTELLITLPTETASTSILSEMFIELTRSKQELGIKTMGLSLTTMDEVFLRVGELTDELLANETSRSSAEGTPEAFHKVLDERMTLKNGQGRLEGLKLVKEQFLALLTKKYIYTLRKRKLMLSQLIIPVVILILAIWVSNKSFETPEPPPALEIKLDSYKKPVTLASSTDPTFSAQLASVIGASYKQVPNGGSVLTAISDLGVSDLAAYRETHIIAAEVNSTNFNALFNSIPNHAAPLAINIASNTLLKNLDPNNNYRINVKNHPLQSKMDALLEAAKPDPIFTQTIPFMFAVFMPIGLALLAASFVVFPLEEKLCNAKQLQMMTGVSPLSYWYSAFLWDFFLVFLVVCVMTACFPIFQSYSVFTSYGGAGVVFLILLVYGYSAISFSYLISLYSSTVAGGFALVSIIHIVSGMILCLLVHLMEIGDLLTMAGKVRWVGRLFPTFGASINTMRFSEIASNNGRCNILSDEARSLICDINIKTIPSEYRECCENCVELDSKCFKPTPYITWEYIKHGFGNDIVAPGIGQELLYMILMAIVYQIILVLLEYEVLQRIIALIFRTDESVFDAQINDEDVMAESQRVANMVTDKKVSEDALVVENLCKSYGSFAAVSKLSFGVHHGECFGLLGVNGAGKTTTFRMLTGDEYRSHGNGYAYMNTLDKDRKKFLSNIGYCPQFDGVVGVLTGREMLQLFCRLRGVPGKFGKAEAEKWLKRLGLLESSDVQCRKYSGGMKRRLSVAMAMIGDPPLLLLDEPTSGVDPVSRQQFWGVLSSVRDSGQAIILTSHSMEECEALCSRLAIMVNGQLQCLAGVQRLKSKFAQGYSLSLKLKPLVPVESEELLKLSDDINKLFHPCTLKDKHQNILQYQLHNTAIPWDVLFKTMEDLKTTYAGIVEDYSVNETSLEDVFLSFARKQYGNRKADVSLLRRIINCQLTNC